MLAKFKFLISVFLITSFIAIVFINGNVGKSDTKKIEKISRPFNVKVDPIRRESMQQTVPVIGRLVAKKAGEVSAIIAGAVEIFNVDVGDRVTKGDVLVTLSQKSIALERNLKQATLDYYKANLDTINTSVKLLIKELSRLESLKNSPAFSQARLEDKTLELAAAKSRVREAEAQLNSAEINVEITELQLSYSQIKAPYNGVITERLTEVGTYVKSGQAILSLINDQNLEIEADIPASRLPGIKIGHKVNAVLENGKDCISVVRSIVPEENPKTRTRTVRLTHQFHATNDRLAVNQTVTIHILAAQKENVLTVHKDAVLNRNGLQLVFIASNNVAKLKPVVLGSAVGPRFVVQKGLKTGQFAIIRGNERLQPEQRITFKLPETEVR